MKATIHVKEGKIPEVPVAEVTAAGAEEWAAGILEEGAEEGTDGVAEKAMKNGRRCVNSSRRPPR